MRTEYCGQLRQSHVGQQVTLCGWVNRRRDLGSLIFIDMRDREGIVQVFFDPDRADALKLASELRNEFCIQVTGTVRAREEKNINADMATGAIEVLASDLTIINRSRIAAAGLQSRQHRRSASEIPLPRPASSGDGAAPEKPARKLPALCAALWTTMASSTSKPRC